MGNCFSLVYREEPLSLTLTDGTIKECVLREFSGERRSEYFNSINRFFEKDEKGNEKVVYKGHQESLIAMCLFGKGGETFTKEQIALWPFSVIQALYEKACNLNGFTNESKQEAKNS